MQWEKFHCLPAHPHDLLAFLFVQLFIFLLVYFFPLLSVLFTWTEPCLFLFWLLALLQAVILRYKHNSSMYNSISGWICICESLYLASCITDLGIHADHAACLDNSRVYCTARPHHRDSPFIHSPAACLFLCISLFVLISSRMVQFPVLLFFYLFPCSISTLQTLTVFLDLRSTSLLVLVLFWDLLLGPCASATVAPVYQ